MSLCVLHVPSIFFFCMGPEMFSNTLSSNIHQNKRLYLLFYIFKPRLNFAPIQRGISYTFIPLLNERHASVMPFESR
jgi:hypothetical protein